LIAAAAMEKNNLKNKKDFNYKARSSQWKVFLVYALSFGIPSSILIAPTAYYISDLYRSRKGFPFYGQEENYGIKFLIVSEVIFSVYSLFSIFCFLLSYTSYKQNKENKISFTSPIFEYNKNDLMKIGINIRLK